MGRRIGLSFGLAAYTGPMPVFLDRKGKGKGNAGDALRSSMPSWGVFQLQHVTPSPEAQATNHQPVTPVLWSQSWAPSIAWSSGAWASLPWHVREG